MNGIIPENNVEIFSTLAEEFSCFRQRVGSPSTSRPVRVRGGLGATVARVLDPIIPAVRSRDAAAALPVMRRSSCTPATPTVLCTLLRRCL